MCGLRQLNIGLNEQIKIFDLLKFLIETFDKLILQVFHMSKHFSWSGIFQLQINLLDQMLNLLFILIGSVLIQKQLYQGFFHPLTDHAILDGF